MLQRVALGTDCVCLASAPHRLQVGLQAKVTPAAFAAAAEAVASRAAALHMGLPREGLPEDGDSLEGGWRPGGVAGGWMEWQGVTRQVLDPV